MQEFSSEMEDTQPQNGETIARKEANMDENVAEQHGPANREVTMITDEQVNFASVLQTLLQRFDRQDELTCGMNEKLEALASVQTVCRDQLENIHQRSAIESPQPRRTSSPTKQPEQAGASNNDRINGQPRRPTDDSSYNPSTLRHS